MSLDFEEDLRRQLQDPKEAAAYMQAALMEGDAETLLIALQTLAQVKGGLSALAKKTGLHRVHLYRMLGKQGNPSFKNFLAIVEALGLHMEFKAPSLPKRARAGERPKAKA